MADHVIVSKGKGSQEHERKNPALKTPEDWDKQEKAEPNRPRPEDKISGAVGCPIYFEAYTNFEWRHTRLSPPLTVSRFYPHERLIVDFPKSEEEMKLRVSTFDSLGVKYFWVLPGEQLNAKDFGNRLKEVREKHAKADY